MDFNSNIYNIVKQNTLYNNSPTINDVKSLQIIFRSENDRDNVYLSLISRILKNLPKKDDNNEKRKRKIHIILRSLKINQSYYNEYPPTIKIIQKLNEVCLILIQIDNSAIKKSTATLSNLLIRKSHEKIKQQEEDKLHFKIKSPKKKIELSEKILTLNRYNKNGIEFYYPGLVSEAKVFHSKKLERSLILQPSFGGQFRAVYKNITYTRKKRHGKNKTEIQTKKIIKDLNEEKIICVNLKKFQNKINEIYFEKNKKKKKKRKKLLRKDRQISIKNIKNYLESKYVLHGGDFVLKSNEIKIILKIVSKLKNIENYEEKLFSQIWIKLLINSYIQKEEEKFYKYLSVLKIMCKSSDPLVCKCALDLWFNLLIYGNLKVTIQQHSTKDQNFQKKLKRNYDKVSNFETILINFLQDLFNVLFYSKSKKMVLISKRVLQIASRIFFFCITRNGKIIKRKIRQFKLQNIIPLLQSIDFIPLQHGITLINVLMYKTYMEVKRPIFGHRLFPADISNNIYFISQVYSKSPCFLIRENLFLLIYDYFISQIYLKQKQNLLNLPSKLDQINSNQNVKHQLKHVVIDQSIYIYNLLKLIDSPHKFNQLWKYSKNDFYSEIFNFINEQYFLNPKNNKKISINNLPKKLFQLILFEFDKLINYPKKMLRGNDNDGFELLFQIINTNSIGGVNLDKVTSLLYSNDFIKMEKVIYCIFLILRKIYLNKPKINNDNNNNNNNTQFGKNKMDFNKKRNSFKGKRQFLLYFSSLAKNKNPKIRSIYLQIISRMIIYFKSTLLVEHGLTSEIEFIINYFNEKLIIFCGNKKVLSQNNLRFILQMIIEISTIDQKNSKSISKCISSIHQIIATELLISKNILQLISITILQYLFVNLKKKSSNEYIRIAMLHLIIEKTRKSKTDLNSIGGLSFFINLIDDVHPRISYLASIFLYHYWKNNKQKVYLDLNAQIKLKYKENPIYLSNMVFKIKELLEIGEQYLID
ncbi:conditional loss-of-growth [Anaeramoeba flamelloides]|uniref:Conditional loss-of-growth n=1 Tax=Anaeramoeba flamelloides TaxID=1746091 RepID=A0AAV7Y9G6_9EUKA|nr:conditional loss-of-growth [Anaeramoeba flamelloides]